MKPEALTSRTYVPAEPGTTHESEQDIVVTMRPLTLIVATSGDSRAAAERSVIETADPSGQGGVTHGPSVHPTSATATASKRGMFM